MIATKGVIQHQPIRFKPRMYPTSAKKQFEIKESSSSPRLGDELEELEFLGVIDI